MDRMLLKETRLCHDINKIITTASRSLLSKKKIQLHDRFVGVGTRIFWG